MEKKIEVLNSPVPPGGRRMTSGEIKALRQLGFCVSNRTYLRPFSPFIDYYATPYRPCGDGFSSMGITLSTR